MRAQPEIGAAHAASVGDALCVEQPELEVQHAPPALPPLGAGGIVELRTCRTPRDGK
jgi:hypothetical protein